MSLVASRGHVKKPEVRWSLDPAKFLLVSTLDLRTLTIIEVGASLGRNFSASRGRDQEGGCRCYLFAGRC